MKKVYYIGDWAIQLGPVYAETPFNHATKGTELINYGKWLKKALEDAGWAVTSVPTWDFYLLEPGQWEKILKEYDVIVFSDVEAKNFQLAPQFFNHRIFGTRVLTFPDRIRLTVEAVQRGTHVVFLGGWLSFNGEMGKGGWGRAGLREILPVECLDVEDLRESTEGFCAGKWDKKHPALKGVRLDSLPPILGYNIVRPRSGCEVIASWDTGDPMIATGRFGKGKVLVYTSDPAPHWGCNFVFWKNYGLFWKKLFAYLDRA